MEHLREQWRKTAAMNDVAHRGVSLALDERQGVPILEALAKRQRNIADRLVIDAMAETVKNRWWAAGAQESDEAGRWWTTRKSEAYEYSFSDEGAWMTLPVVMTATFSGAPGTGYNDGTYVWHLDPGHPVTITEFEACYPSDPQGLLDAWRGVTSPGNFDRPETRWDGDWVKLNIPSMRTTASGNVVFDSVSDDPGRWDSYSQKWPKRKQEMTGRTKRFGECTLYLQDYGDDREVFAVIGDRVVGTAYFGYVGAQLKAAVQVDPKFRRRGIATAMYSWIEEIARDTLTPDVPHTPLAEALWNQPNRPFGRTSALSLEDLISVAEEAMERGGLAGRTIKVPVGHMDDPEYQAAIAPLVAWVRSITKSNIRFYASDYTLDREGGGAQAMTDGYNKIVVRPVTTEMTVLHECAHVLRATDSGHGHDAAFAKLLHELYRTHLGEQAAGAFWDIVGERVN